jgi:phosphate uptake regulator
MHLFGLVQITPRSVDQPEIAVRSSRAVQQPKLFANLQSTCFAAHDQALNAFLTGDIELAEKVRRMRNAVEKEFAGIEGLAQSQSPDLVPQVLAIAAFLRQIYEHSVDISDLTVPRKP